MSAVVTAIRSAAWASVAEAKQFVAAVDADADDLVQVLELLQHKALLADAERHALRRMVFHALVLKRSDEALFRPFVRALKTAPVDVRAVLVEVLPRVNAVADQMELVEVMRHPEADVRAAAARVLVVAGSKNAIAALAALTQERGFVGLREALEVILRTAGPQALPLLDKVLQRPDLSERLLAIRWLGDAQHMAGSTGAAQRLLQPLLRDPVEAIAVAAVTAVGQIASEADYHALLAPLVDGKNLHVAAAVLEGLRRFPTARTADLLERKLASGPQVLRLAALACIEGAAAQAAQATTPVDLDPLIGAVVAALGHPHVAVRNRAGEVMAALSRSERVELGRTVVWLLRSGDVHTRRMAAEVLRSVKDPHGELWPKLLGSLRDDDWWVRDRVMDALVDLAGKGLSGYMVAWLQDHSDVVRRFALHVLHRLKDPDTIAAVVHCARTDPDWWAREKAVEVIAEFNDVRALPSLIELMTQTPELQIACIAALRRLALQQAAAFLLPLSTSPEPDVRLLVLGYIEQQNDPAHYATVERMADDDEPAVRRLAAALLARWRVTRQDKLADAAVPAPVVAAAIDGDDRPLESYLRQLTDGGGDLILAPERHVFLKRDGQVEPVSTTPLSADRVATMLAPLVTSQAAVRLEQRKDADFSFELKGAGQRFRVNMFRQRGGLGAVFRAIRSSIPALADLGLPPAVLSLTTMRTGLVLVGGASASGKSTTLAALIDHINRTEPRHIISLEDPIEILHQNHKALVQQRELGAHTRSFSRALRSALREDPDVIVIGEMRDKETIELALTAAETGHLVVGTLHTSSADACIDRIVNAFSRAQQDQVRASLADSLRAVLYQTLLRRRAGLAGPRLVAAELLLNTDAVANLIRKSKTMQLPTTIATSREAGMIALDADLIRLARTGLVDDVDVLARARNKPLVEAALAEARQQQQQHRQSPSRPPTEARKAVS
ncbi:MAG: PilT/PilU family type 4a pilus ATPase [Deltaproteobacteria bacterium]|nr:PilT/PilU family type 4a pilus ATPase [Deltaproteobacteria bacterium]